METGTSTAMKRSMRDWSSGVPRGGAKMRGRPGPSWKIEKVKERGDAAVPEAVLETEAEGEAKPLEVEVR